MKTLAHIFAYSALLVIPITASAAEPKAKGAGKDAATAGAEAAAHYEHVCQTDVFYVARNPSSSEQNEVRFTTLSDEGFDASALQNRLNARISQARAEAIASCNKKNQTQARCLSHKLSGVSTRYPGYNFPQRRLILEAAQRDCRNEQTDCVGTRVSQITCSLNIPPEANIPQEVRQASIIKVNPAAVPANEIAETEIAHERSAGSAAGSGESSAHTGADVVAAKPLPAGSGGSGLKPGESAPPGQKPDDPSNPDNPYSKPFTVN